MHGTLVRVNALSPSSRPLPMMAGIAIEGKSRRRDIGRLRSWPQIVAPIGSGLTSTKLPPTTLKKLKQKDSSSLGAMPKLEIESWIASTASISDDSEDRSPGLPEWRRELILSDWPQAMKIAQKRLFTSSTKARTRFLKEELLYMAKFCGTRPASFERHALTC